MLGRGALSMFSQRGSSASPYANAAYKLALPFKTAGPYWQSGTSYAALSSVPGYSYTRSGAVSFVNSTGTVENFAANVPAIPTGVGYEAYAAATNHITYSSDYTQAAWTKQAGTTVTADQAVAPDGTLTADLVVSNGTNGLYNSAGGAVVNPYCRSVWLKAVTGTPTVVLTNPDSAGASVNCVLTTSWQRFVLTENVAGIGIWVQNIPAAGIHMWQAQVLDGTYPDGGPIIATAGVAASIGDSNLSTNIKPDASALTDTDMLIFARATFGRLTANDQYLLDFTDAGATGPRILCAWSASALTWIVVGASNYVASSAVGVAAGTPLTVVLRRDTAAGTWRGGSYINGTLTWFSAATAVTFPAVSKAYSGIKFSSIVPEDGALGGLFIRTGTFATDAQVIAAIS